MKIRTRKKSQLVYPKNLELLFLFQDLLGRGLAVWKKRQRAKNPCQYI